MSRESRLAIALIGSASVLGVLGDVLFNGQSLGLNVALWLVVFAAALSMLLRAGRAPLHQGRRFMVAPLLLFGALFVWHDSPLLVAANLLALAAAVSMGALRRTRPLRSATLTDYGGGAVAAGCSMIVGAVPLLLTDIRWKEVLGRARSERVAAVGRGLTIAVPLLLLFGGLFVAADAVFKQLLSTAVPSFDGSIVKHAFVALVCAWLAGGLLRDLLAAREESRLVPARALEPVRRTPRVRALEPKIPLPN